MITLNATNITKSTNIFAFFFILLLTACQADSPQTENAVLAPLPPASEDYEANPNQWGFINGKGNLVIPDQFDEVRAFSEGLALVRQNGHWGFVDQSGKLAIPCTYQAAWSFSNGLARVKNKQGNSGFINQSGTFVIQPTWKEATDFKEGFACVRINNQYGFINTQGEVVIQPQFDRSSRFKNGKAVVKKGPYYGMINTNGELVIPFEYERLKPFANQLARASQDNQYGFIDSKGKWVVEPQFIQLSDFHNEQAAAFDGQKWGLINKKGDWITAPEYDQLFWAAENRWIIENNGQYQLVDEKLNVLADQLEEIHPFKENYAPFKKRELWGYLNMEGQVTVEPLYYLVWPFHEGLARVATEYGLTYVDTLGFIAIPPDPNYLELQEFNQGLAPVQLFGENNE